MLGSVAAVIPGQVPLRILSVLSLGRMPALVSGLLLLILRLGVPLTLRVRPLTTLRTPTTFVPGSLWLLAGRSHAALASISRGLGGNLAVALTALSVLSLIALHPGDDVFDLLREAPIVVPVALLPSLIELTLARLLGLALTSALGAVSMALLRGVLSIGLTGLPWTARVSVALLVITSLLALLGIASLLALLGTASLLALLGTALLLVRRLPASLLSTSVLLGVALPASSTSLLAATLLAIAFVLLCATARVLAPLIVAALVLLVTALLLPAAPLLGAAVLSVAPMATLLLPGSLTPAALIALGAIGTAAGPLFVL